jgi:hypothetical protein
MLLLRIGVRQAAALRKADVRNVAVAVMLRKDPLEFPRIPWPLVQPFPNPVPNPTAIPDIRMHSVCWKLGREIDASEYAPSRLQGKNKRRTNPEATKPITKETLSNS